MPTAALTTKYQITVPKEVRETLHVAPGDRLLFRISGNGQVTVEPENRPLSALKGRLKATRHLTLDELKAVARDAVLEKSGGADARS